mgnify:CR=1 FL=1|jgi:hypothetical protein
MSVLAISMAWCYVFRITTENDYVVSISFMPV